MSETDYESRLKLAVDAAKEASELILKYYQTDNIGLESKSDSSPVTVADRGAEELLRMRIGDAFPDDGILGEEFPPKEGTNGYRWILDPIDGTKCFVAGTPLFGTLIGIERDGKMIAGVCRFPALDEVVYAREGGGAWFQTGDKEPKAAQVSSVDQIENALGCFTELAGWYKIERKELFDKLASSARALRGWGDCYGHMLVATGRAEFSIDPIMSPWDIAALIPIVRESGGYCGDWDGNRIIDGGNGVSTNAAMKDKILGMLK
ncbi:histidinol-phosphatase [Thalassoroseus pseudoceratinae]|uniref:histidinol-phosphatase n=1 Tax=Thalassoroseus pseudoceratinae TaxID=2713176 RepID=UPI0014244FA7|nr:histidinol-phosphatase [Thalassoroseus pseudoceratinae]